MLTTTPPIGSKAVPPTIVRYEATFHFMTGISAPKKIVCLGSDGKKYVELVKGHDDLRQDAVMQQVFSVINSSFAATGREDLARLQLRTYKVP